MYLELRTWKGSWFGGESAIHTRAFAHLAPPPRELFSFAAGLRQEGYKIPEPSTYSSYIDIAA